MGAEGFGPPFSGGGRPRGVFVDAIHRARVETLATTGTQFGHDDDIHTVVEDGPKLRRAMADARIAVNAFRHLYAQRQRLPLWVSLAMLDSFGTIRGGHPRNLASLAANREDARLVCAETTPS